MQLLESRAQNTSEFGTGSKRQWCGSPETTSQLDFSNGWHNYSFSQQIERKHKTLVQPCFSALSDERSLNDLIPELPAFDFPAPQHSAEALQGLRRCHLAVRQQLGQPAFEVFE